MGGKEAPILPSPPPRPPSQPLLRPPGALIESSSVDNAPLHTHEKMKINVLFCFFKKRQKVAPAAMNKKNPQNANEEIRNPVPNWHPLPAAAGPGISAPPEEPCAWRYL